jgi:hypothetical protein
LYLLFWPSVLWPDALQNDLFGETQRQALSFRIPADQVLKYKTSAEQIQNLEIMGQSVETESKATTVFSLLSKGLKEHNHQLGITIDSMEVSVTSPQGDLSPDMSTVNGKSFDMTLSLLGKEGNLAGAESIQYELGQSGKRSLVSNFQAIFPDVAGRPVKIGDTWQSKDTITEKTANVEININVDNVNTLEGFETVNGLECVRIKTEATGTIDGKGEQMGADLTFSAELKGTDTWYFAYKDGLFVKLISSASAEGSVDVSGPQSMTIPMTVEIKTKTELIK